MAYYASVVQQLARELSNAFAEINLLKQKLENIQPNVPQVAHTQPIDITTIQEIVDSTVRQEVDKMRQSIETPFTTKMEQYVSKLVKDRVELSLSGIRIQILNDVDLRIEELKEDVLAAAATSSIRSMQVLEDVQIVPPTAANIERAFSPPSPPSPITMASPLGTSLDIEALTKDILAQSETASLAGDSEINFGTRKKTLRKNK